MAHALVHASRVRRPLGRVESPQLSAEYWASLERPIDEDDYERLFKCLCLKSHPAVAAVEAHLELRGTYRPRRVARW